MQRHSTFRLMTVTAMIFSLITLTVAPLRAQGAPQQVQAGTSVTLKTSGATATQGTNVGDIITLTVVSDVIVGGRVVFATGAPARAEITLVNNAGIAGIPGGITMRLQSLTAVDGTIVPLSATKAVMGDSHLVMAVVLGLLCLPLIFVVKGGQAAIPAGTIVQATTNAEVAIRGEALATSR